MVIFEKNKDAGHSVSIRKSVYDSGMNDTVFTHQVNRYPSISTTRTTGDNSNGFHQNEGPHTTEPSKLTDKNMDERYSARADDVDRARGDMLKQF